MMDPKFFAAKAVFSASRSALLAAARWSEVDLRERPVKILGRCWDPSLMIDFNLCVRSQNAAEDVNIYIQISWSRKFFEERIWVFSKIESETMPGMRPEARRIRRWSRARGCIREQPGQQKESSRSSFAERGSLVCVCREAQGQPQWTIFGWERSRHNAKTRQMPSWIFRQ